MTIPQQEQLALRIYRAIGGITLLLAIAGVHWSYSLVRWVVAILFAILVGYSHHMATRRKATYAGAWRLLSVLFGVGVVIFNPAWPFHFSRPTWLALDWLALGPLIASEILDQRSKTRSGSA